MWKGLRGTRQGTPWTEYITITHTQTSLQRMPLDWGRTPKKPEETPKLQVEHANPTHTGQRWESNPVAPDMRGKHATH